MSIKLMSRVYEKDIDASLQRVLLVLCDYANDEGTNCYPSIDRIAWKLGANRKTVMRAIQRAEALGAVGVHREHRHNNRYTIHLDALDDKQPFDVESQNGTQENTPRGLKGTQEGTERDSNGDSEGPHPPVEPPIEPSTPSRKRGRLEYTDDFEQFWREYPKRVSKGEAFTEWKAINPDPALRDRIMEAVRQQKAHRKDWQKENGKYIPHPSRWLKYGRWEDEVVSVPSVRRFEV